MRPFITPALLMEAWLSSEVTTALVERSFNALAAVLQGQDDRLLVVVGPCSIHNHEALRASGRREHVMVDLSHGKSDKQHRRQIKIASALAHRIAVGEHWLSVDLIVRALDSRDAMSAISRNRRG